MVPGSWRIGPDLPGTMTSRCGSVSTADMQHQTVQTQEDTSFANMKKLLGSYVSVVQDSRGISY